MHMVPGISKRHSRIDYNPGHALYAPIQVLWVHLLVIAQNSDDLLFRLQYPMMVHTTTDLISF